MLLAPSLLSSDWMNLEKTIATLEYSEADWLHFDVMDGNFVPNITFGIPICEEIAKHTNKPLDVHLMISQPERYIKAFKQAGASILTVHYEACNHLHRTIQFIKSLDCQAGVAINPHTNVQNLEDILPILDLVCIMSVNPGFSGQKFIDHTYQKIKQLQAMIQIAKSTTKIEVDGGVTLQNAPQILDAGADILVAGHAIFKAKNNLVQVIQQFKQLAHGLPKNNL